MNKETHKFSVSLVNNAYYQLIIKDNVEFTVADCKQLVAFENELCGKILPVLIISSPNSTADSDLLKYISKKENNPYAKAAAYVLTSLAQKILANFYIKVAPPQRPTKFFKDKETALKWLEQYF